MRYLEDYLDNINTLDKMGDKAKEVFRSFNNFKKAIIRIYKDSDQYKKAAINIQYL